MRAQSDYVFVIGVVLFIFGVWGFFQDPIFGIFGAGVYLNLLHIFSGILGLGLSLKKPRAYSLWLGWLILAVGVLGFIPLADILLAQVLGINTAMSWLHIAIGIVSLLGGYAIRE